MIFLPKKKKRTRNKCPSPSHGPFGLTTETKALNQFTVTCNVLVTKVRKQVTATSNHFQKTAT